MTCQIFSLSLSLSRLPSARQRSVLPLNADAHGPDVVQLNAVLCETGVVEDLLFASDARACRTRVEGRRAVEFVGFIVTVEFAVADECVRQTADGVAAEQMQWTTIEIICSMRVRASGDGRRDLLV